MLSVGTTRQDNDIFCLRHCVVGNVINVETGEWTGKMSGLGAGLDSFYEYLLKVTCNFRKVTVGDVNTPLILDHISRSSD